jgi:hypothetical protein
MSTPKTRRSIVLAQMSALMGTETGFVRLPLGAADFRNRWCSQQVDPTLSLKRERWVCAMSVQSACDFLSKNGFKILWDPAVTALVRRALRLSSGAGSGGRSGKSFRARRPMQPPAQDAEVGVLNIGQQFPAKPVGRERPMSDIQRRRQSNEIIVVAPIQSAARARAWRCRRKR